MSFYAMEDGPEPRHALSGTESESSASSPPPVRRSQDKAAAAASAESDSPRESGSARRENFQHDDHSSHRHLHEAKGEASPVPEENLHEKQAQLWVNVIEGRDFPEHLRGTAPFSATYSDQRPSVGPPESHVVAKVGEYHVTGKPTKHDLNTPKWGETFIIDRRNREPELVIEVKATHLVLSSVVFVAHLKIEDVFKRGQIFAWIKSDQHESSVLVHIRTMHLESTARHNRLKSLRLELQTRTVTPNGTLKGCVVYAANRPRSFTKMQLTLKHGTLGYEGKDSSTTMNKRVYFHAKVALQQHYPVEVLPGTYYWPFTASMPGHLYKTGETRGTQINDKWETYFELTVTLKSGSSKKQKLAELTIVSADKAPAPSNPKYMSIAPPSVKFFSETPLNPDSVDPREAGPLKEAKIPSATCCAAVDKALYPTTT